MYLVYRQDFPEGRIPVCRLLMLSHAVHGSKWVFRLTGSTHCSRCQTSFFRCKKCGITALETVKIWNFADKFAPEWRIVCTNCTKFSAFVCVYSLYVFLVWSLSVNKQPSYKHLPLMGAFSHKFSIAPSGKTIDRNTAIFKFFELPKKLGVQNGTNLL